MMKISDAVREILESSEVALTAFSEGYLNLSAYAKSIRKEVGEKTKKPVTTGSIVVTLSRMRRKTHAKVRLVPKVEIEDIAVKSGLCEITFHKTPEHMRRIKFLLQDEDLRASEFLTITQGVGEITVIALETAQKKVIQFFKPHKPKAMIGDLVSISVRFSEIYIWVPNITYALVRQFALARLNIVEIISTYTELTFIVHQKDLEPAFLILQKMTKS